MDTSKVFRPAASSRWNPDSVGRLSRDEIVQLRANALRLGADEVIAFCDEALAAGRDAARRKPLASPAKDHHGMLVSRRAAFQMRGVTLHAGLSSWSGVRADDGMVVFSLWADDVRREEGRCRCLLWAPNESGSRPWSDTPAGKERLQHCLLAESRGKAEGLLVHGVREEGCLPEERARTVRGVDPAVVIRFAVERRGEAFWAVWGAKAEASPLR